MTAKLKKLNKILIANRGEIAIRIFRAATELKIRTVAMYTYEDRYSLHRYKADESYQIGRDDEPLRPYIDIDQVLKLAKEQGVDAIHPGYGFISENVNLARACEEQGIIFVGPRPDVMDKLGDKIRAKKIARQVGVPVIEDSREPLKNIDIAKKEAARITYPVIIKASAGGGGRGMRVVRNDRELESCFDEARSEALKAFGDDTVFFEKYIEDPKHIEVQILGDNYGNIVHLFERDCSVQRRFQKVVEVAPAPTLSPQVRNELHQYALKIAHHVKYNNAGTVEFLVDPQERVYFIEVNPRIQVEHTVTEEITGIDIVRSQILIARGHALHDAGIFLRTQEDVTYHGYAIQCRITTEDPQNNFKPDYGRIVAYRSPGGFGIRLDGGSAYPGVNVSPFFDSLLVKVTAKGRTLRGACERIKRALEEFRIRGVKTNIAFLENVITHPVFIDGRATVRFIDNHAELFQFVRRRDRASKVLRYLGDLIVNGNPDVKTFDREREFRREVVPECDKFAPYPDGSKQRLSQLGRDGFVKWLKETRTIQYTDTTFRDAHQSLLATRVRTIDMLRVAESFAKKHPEVFSMEVWGGATFDVALRFLHECPWERLRLLREAMPNILLQMLLRGSNAVGYTSYPDNLVSMFVEKSWEAGVDIFRIFDSMNNLEEMKVSIKAVRDRTGGLAEGCICYTGDLLDPTRRKYGLQYYIDLARRLEDQGIHILGIKDMAGLLKPYAAEQLIAELRNVLTVPIHLHTHDTSSLQTATYLKAVEAGVDVVDVALASMSGLTSQPNFNSVVAMLKGHERELKLDLQSLNQFSNYWEAVREFYYPFESGLKSGTAEVFEHEIPGGQYSNLRPQARALGLEDEFEKIKRNFAGVNKLFGDIVKVTPSSKVVGDFALYLTANNIDPEDVLAKADTISFPESVKSMFKGEIGVPPEGFPAELQSAILKGEKPLQGRSNEHLPPVDFDAEYEAFLKKFDSSLTFLDYLSYKMYPKVYEDYYYHWETYGRVDPIPTPVFFYGLKLNEEVLVPIDQGKTLIVRFLNVSEPDESGMRTIFFKLNGENRGIEVRDRSYKVTKVSNVKATKPNEIGSPLQGRLSKLLVKEQVAVSKNQPLFVIEAMKMESTIRASFEGKIRRLHLKEGSLVEQDDLVVEME